MTALIGRNMSFLVVVNLALLTTSALAGNVMMTWDSDTVGVAPDAANATGIDSFLPAIAGDSLGTVVTSFSWDAGATPKTLTPYAGANMYQLNVGSPQVRSRAWLQTGAIQTGATTGGIVPFSTMVHFAIDNDIDDGGLNLGLSGNEPQFALSDSTLGHYIFRLSLAQGGGAMVWQENGTLTYHGMPGGTAFNENDWYQLYGTVDFNTKTWDLNKKNMTTGQIDTWTDYPFADLSCDDIGMVYFRGTTGDTIQVFYDTTIIGEDLAFLAGDANGDGSVNLADLGILIDNYGMTSGAVWANGDFNDDGSVNLADLGSLIDNYGSVGGSGLDFAGQQLLVGAGFFGGPVNTVPEPSALALLATSLVGLLAYAWRKRR